LVYPAQIQAAAGIYRQLSWKANSTKLLSTHHPIPHHPNNIITNESPIIQSPIITIEFIGYGEWKSMR
jgi:hypothetical protein